MRMKWAALITWVITALGGFGLFAIWLRRGGVEQSDQPGRRIRPPLIFTHLGLAATGLVLWIIYVANDKKGFAWAGFILLLVVAGLGFTMLALWLQRRQAAAGGGGAAPLAEGNTPAEQHFPVPLVVGHGLIAATTLVLVLLAALDVGGS
jgi:ABC-type xylose transport system permease subunit